MIKNKTVTKTVDEIINGEYTPISLNVIPNNMGINLCAVDSLTWTKQKDNQLVNLTINFIPNNRLKKDIEIIGDTIEDSNKTKTNI
jgi:hypothetical protein